MSQQPVFPRPAATLILARDGDQGIEIFMMQRSLHSDFVGGAYVFPGGGLDRRDSSPEAFALCVGLTDAQASRRLKMANGGLAYWVAVIRECFEEAGLFMVYDRDGKLLSLADPEKAKRFGGYRNTLHGGELDLAELCRKEGLRLATDRVAYFAHWITPVESPQRFDTRFFVAVAPENQTGFHDDKETVAHAWLRPQEAIERARSGQYNIIFPTLSNIRALLPFSTTAELMAHASSERDIPAILPRRVKFPDGTVRPVLPGQPGYDDLPGPNPAPA